MNESGIFQLKGTSDLKGKKVNSNLNIPGQNKMKGILLLICIASVIKCVFLIESKQMLSVCTHGNSLIPIKFICIKSAL